MGGGAGRPVLTALQPDPSRPGSVRVYADGRLYCTVDEGALEGVAVGRPVDRALAERLEAAADLEAAYRTVLRALERRPYARADLARRMLRRGHPREAVEAALERAQARGLLDDAEFARNFVETRAARGRGPARLVRDLLAMGVERCLIDRAIAAQWPEGAVGPAVPAALAAKRAAQLGDLARPVKRRRLLAYLARRGFTGREAVEAVVKVL